MHNIYWPVYKNLETEFVRLMFDIHIDDSQLSVYSFRIADLILRAAVEIESISKELYTLNGGVKVADIKYDEDALKYLNTLWKLDKKVILISSINCFQSNKILKPFEKNTIRSGQTRLTFGWNNAYQNLKHDRGNSLSFGNLKYLFEIMAALFILNIYFKDESYELGKDSRATIFPTNIGSEIFSIKLDRWTSYNKWEYSRWPDFEECIYFTKILKKWEDVVNKTDFEGNEKRKELFLNHPKFLEYIKINNIQEYTGNNLMWDILWQEEYINVVRATSGAQTKVWQNVEYEAVLNK